MALMAVVVFATEGGQTAVPTLALFLAAGTRMLPCLVRLITALSAISVGLPAMRMIVADLHEFPAPAVLPGPPAGRAPVGDLVVENLTFRYPETTEPVVRDVSFTVPHGTSLAIVGPSGSGKTTLVDLLLGVHTPTSGQVRVAGRPIQDLLPEWQTGVAMVPQDVFWIDDTLAANIAFGVPVEDRDLIAWRVPCSAPSSRTWSPRCPTGSTPPSASGVCASPGDSASGSASPGRCTATRS